MKYMLTTYGRSSQEIFLKLRIDPEFFALKNRNWYSQLHPSGHNRRRASFCDRSQKDEYRSRRDSYSTAPQDDSKVIV